MPVFSGHFGLHHARSSVYVRVLNLCLPGQKGRHVGLCFCVPGVEFLPSHFTRPLLKRNVTIVVEDRVATVAVSVWQQRIGGWME